MTVADAQQSSPTPRDAAPPSLPDAASRQDGTYPRPQLVRSRHVALDREVGFAYDDADSGRDERWQTREDVFDRRIRLPFAPESAASGIGDEGFHPVVWYRIPLETADLTAAGRGSQGERMLLHFGAVDYRADVWVDGEHVASHEGGQTPFSADVTAALDSTTDDHVVVVRAEDDPIDVAIPRGKQDWQPEPHAIWYSRQTGIWQTVWLEAVPAVHLSALQWIPGRRSDEVRLEFELSRRPASPHELEVVVDVDGRRLARLVLEVDDVRGAVDIPLRGQENGQQFEDLVWWPSRPRLIDAAITLRESGAQASAGRPGEVDRVASYFGLRSITTANGRFQLNDRPVFVRSVLEQGYWPESHFTAPDAAALRSEVELVKKLGFSAVRVHQKVEDPRFLYWCDRLGVMVWGETANAFTFGRVPVERLVRDWLDILRRDLSHPSIVTWVPINESWGVQHAVSERSQRDYTRSLADLTRALDPTRPVISNDGWEHTDSDLWTIHDYESDGEVLRARYGDAASVDRVLTGIGPAGRPLVLEGLGEESRPVMLTEFGGVAYLAKTDGDDEEGGWGYSTAADAEDFRSRLEAILSAVRASPVLSGFCYTQLTDTRQEKNGLCDENRVPKLPAEVIAALVRG